MEIQGIKASVNMWALLNDNDPGDHSPSIAVYQKPSKPTAAAAVETPASNGDNAAAIRGKKSKKKRAAGDKQAPPNGEVSVDVHAPNDEEAQSSNDDGGQRKEEKAANRRKEKNKAPAVPGKQAETSGGGGDISGSKPEGDGDTLAAGGSRCRVGARRICKAVVVVAFFALCFQLASQPPVAGRAI